MLNNPEDITQKWKEYFKTLLNEETITDKQAETEDTTENYTEEDIINIEEIEDATRNHNRQASRNGRHDRKLYRRGHHQYRRNRRCDKVLKMTKRLVMT
ncbi:hypothetical protein QE152_g10238 [Popillia japonica]|uniref:Uncharacterized protein n=1 Tax=Popillia japonica TaxID=7064 RepID=A0AAW1LVV6_POPJA